MNKQEFIKELRDCLSILSESEVNDIIDEYSDVINQKVQDGKTEEEAVKDFGSINDLVAEILGAYKINPNRKSYSFHNDFETILNNSINKGAEFFRNIFKDISADGAARFLVYGLIAIIVLILLRIPFAIVESLLYGLLTFGHRGNLISSIISIALSLAYLVSCILVVAAMVKSISKSTDFNNKKKDKTYTYEYKYDDSKIKQTNTYEYKYDSKEEKEYAYSSNDNKDQTSYSADVPRKEYNTFLRTLYGIFKVIVVFIMIPFWILLIIGCILIAVGIYLAFQGVNLVGFIFIAIGGVGFLGSLLGLVERAVFRPYKHNRVALFATNIVISSVFFGIGLALSFNMLFQSDELYLTTSNFERYLTTEKNTYDLDIYADARYCFGDADVKIIEERSSSNRLEIEITSPTYLSPVFREDTLHLKTNPVSFVKTIVASISDNKLIHFEDDIRDYAQVNIYIPSNHLNNYSYSNQCIRFK